MRRQPSQLGSGARDRGRPPRAARAAGPRHAGALEPLAPSPGAAVGPVAASARRSASATRRASTHPATCTATCASAHRTWIGPFTLLDGTGGLQIGENCSISAGVQIYTHDTVAWALSGGAAEYERAPVSIGDCCHIGAQAVIVKGVSIGDHCVIGATSFVNRDVPPFTIAAGSPCRPIGRVGIAEGRVSSSSVTDRRPRIFIGLQEIADYYAPLQEGLEELGYDAVLVTVGRHPFYGMVSRGAVPAVARVAMAAADRDCRSLGRPLPLRLWWWCTARFLRLPVLAWALATRDTFVFGFGSSFCAYLELPLLKLLRKRVVYVFHGSDSRPPYLDGAATRPDALRPGRARPVDATDEATCADDRPVGGRRGGQPALGALSRATDRVLSSHRRTTDSCAQRASGTSRRRPRPALAVASRSEGLGRDPSDCRASPGTRAPTRAGGAERRPTPTGPGRATGCRHRRRPALLRRRAGGVRGRGRGRRPAGRRRWLRPRRDRRGILRSAVSAHRVLSPGRAREPLSSAWDATASFDRSWGAPLATTSSAEAPAARRGPAPARRDRRAEAGVDLDPQRITYVHGCGLTESAARALVRATVEQRRPVSALRERQAGSSRHGWSSSRPARDADNRTVCGIAGIAGGAPPDRALLGRMAATMENRGPDGEGVWSDDVAGFAFRRLAIIDLHERSNQPLHLGPLHLVFNGEIYNYRELRDELRGRGHAFETEGDAEVLLHAWAEWGEGALDRFNGMFAFAVWDDSDADAHARVRPVRREAPLLRPRRRAARLRLRDQGDPARPGRAGGRRRGGGRALPRARRRCPRSSAPSSAGSRGSPPPTCCAGATGGSTSGATGRRAG